MKITINEDQRGLLFKKGNYIKHLKPGEYTIFPFIDQKHIEVLNVFEPFGLKNKSIELFLKDASLVAELALIDVADHEVVLHYIDGKLSNLLTGGKYAYWNVMQKHTFTPYDRKVPLAPQEIKLALSRLPPLGAFLVKVDVSSFQKGLIFYDSVLQEEFGPGLYYFWKEPVHVSAQLVDLRQQQLDMAGQEIMTWDKVTLRLNFVCHYRIVNGIKCCIEIKDYQEQLYILLQLILREYVGTLKLDELLQKKEEIGSFVLEKLREKERDFGLEFSFAGIKDIILPGEIKNILNTVLIAEKKAQANIITRREETASTRSLLNTAKLMDENKTLYRLKELEFLENICEKVGSITLNGNANLLESINELAGAIKGSS